MLKITLLLVAVGLAACGTKAGLSLPPGTAPEPLLGHPKPATPPPAKPQETQPKAKTAADDSSTTKENTR